MWGQGVTCSQMMLLHVKVRLRLREVADGELCITARTRQGWQDTHRDKKMYEYQLRLDEVRRHELRGGSDITESIEKAESNKSLRNQNSEIRAKIGIQSHRWSLVPIPLLSQRTAATCYHIDFPVHWSVPGAHHWVSTAPSCTSANMKELNMHVYYPVRQLNRIPH